MKKITLLAALFAAFTMQAQLFSDDFEDLDISDWTQLDEDGDTNTFFAFDGGDGSIAVMTSASYLNGVGPLTPDNYSISPAIDLAGNNSLELTYMVGGQDPLFSAEVYTVYVSTGNTVADFMNTDPTVTVSFNEDLGNDPAAAGALVPRSLDVSSLAGASNVYIAFRHHDVTDQYYINFDDVELNGALSIADLNFANFNYFVANNQLNISANTSMEKVVLYNMLGQQVVSQKLNSHNETIELSGLQSGIYIASVFIDGASKSFKIVKN